MTLVNTISSSQPDPQFYPGLKDLLITIFFSTATLITMLVMAGELHKIDTQPPEI